MTEEELKKEEDEKIRLELIVLKEIRSILSRMNKENSKMISSLGTTTDATNYQAEWEALLRKHYQRVQEAFSKIVDDTFPEKISSISDEQTAILFLSLMSWSNESAKENAKIITDTNNRQLEQAKEIARQILIEEGKPTDNRSLALMTAIVFRRLSKQRAEVIANVATESTAELTKMMSAYAIEGLDLSKPLGMLQTQSKATKKWWTVGDNRVRPHHADVHGDEKKIHEAFLVGGELLMFPGDASLGATPKNLANCRCSLSYHFKG